MGRYAYRRSYQWNANLAYVAGLFASDGCLVNDGRHMVMTSKDYEIIAYVQDILDIHTKVRPKRGQYNPNSLAYDFQFSNVALYDFFLASGIGVAKSKTIQAVTVPDEFYADFLRGYFDGDGTTYGYRDNRWPNSYMYYCEFISASLSFLHWMQATNSRLLGVTTGSIKPKIRAYTLVYAKRDSRKLFEAFYANSISPRLTRKYDALRGFIETDPYAKIA